MIDTFKKHIREEWETPEGKLDILTIGALLFVLVTVTVAGALAS